MHLETSPGKDPCASYDRQLLNSYPCLQLEARLAANPINEPRAFLDYVLEHGGGGEIRTGCFALDVFCPTRMGDWLDDPRADEHKMALLCTMPILQRIHALGPEYTKDMVPDGEPTE